MSIRGLTIDYGPFGFLDAYNPKFIPNYSDDEGRYSFERQPSVGKIPFSQSISNLSVSIFVCSYCLPSSISLGLYNLEKLAHAFSPLLDYSTTSSFLKNNYWDLYNNYYYSIMFNKIGIPLPVPTAANDKNSNTNNNNNISKEDQQFIDELLRIMAQMGLDYTIFFRSLADIAATILDNPSQTFVDCSPLLSVYSNEEVHMEPMIEWIQHKYKARLLQQEEREEDNELDTPRNSIGKQRRQRMNSINPKYILRNYLAQKAIEEMERIIDASTTTTTTTNQITGDNEMIRLLQLLRDPYGKEGEEEGKPAEEIATKRGFDSHLYSQLPPEWSKAVKVSCSS